MSNIQTVKHLKKLRYEGRKQCDSTLQRESCSRLCNMGNMKVGGGAARPITLMIACKLKTNVFIFGSQDSAAELPGFIPPLGQPKDM